MKATRIACLAVLIGLVRGVTADAAILEDFGFSDASGTLLGAAVNSANAGNNWLVHANTVESAVNGGSFRIQKQSATAQAANALEIANVTSGTVWLVAELAGWNYTATASSPSERVRFAFLENDPASAGGSTVTAEANIDRSGNGLALIGDAIGFGSVDPAGSYALPLVQTNPFKLAVELNKTANTFNISYKDGANPWGSIGSGVLGDVNASMSTGVIRSGNSIRFAFTGTFGDTGEFVDVDRIYLTNTNPIPEPGSVVLAVFIGSGWLWRRRRSA